jgi:hypothetical protein
MRFLGGHLGSSVSARVDGQLDHATTERAWNHVLGCPHCRAQVEREIWVKNRLALLAGDEPAPPLVEMLHELVSSDASSGPGDPPPFSGADRSVRARRLTVLALLGVGSATAAVFAVATLSGPLGLDPRSGTPASIGGATPGSSPSPSATSTSEPTQSGPSAHVHGTLHGWRTERPGLAVPRAAARDR